MNHNRLMTFIIMIAFALVMIPSTFAQEETTPMTITVTGMGSASAEPDMATIEIGVEIPNVDIAVAYSEVNDTIGTIIEALNELDIAREDIRTTGLNIFSEGGGFEAQAQNRFRVMNRLNVTVRDLDMIESVIDTAVSNGANTIFGLQFGISEPSALQSDARANALDDARTRAGEIADNIGVTLGDVVSVTELQGGGFPFPVSDMAMGNFGGAESAVVEPGTIGVQIQVEVTFNFSR
ncbi:MAG: SIMPL domain-containing protein [Chloroflexota bacterium]